MIETQTLPGFSRLLSMSQMPNHQSFKDYFWSAKYYIRTCRVGDVSYNDIWVCTFSLGVCGFIGGGLCVRNCFNRVWLFVTPRTIAHQASLSVGFLGKNTGVGFHALLQGIFPTQGSSPLLLCLLHCRQILWERNCTREEMDLVLISTSLRLCEPNTGKLPSKRFSALCLDK